VTSPDLAVLAREWLRDYYAPPEVKSVPAAEVTEHAKELPNRNN